MSFEPSLIYTDAITADPVTFATDIPTTVSQLSAVNKVAADVALIEVEGILIVPSFNTLNKVTSALLTRCKLVPFIFRGYYRITFF